MRVLLPSALVRLFPGCPGSVEVEAETVAEVIDALDGRWPGMRDRLCDATPGLRRHINVFVGGRRVGLDAELGGAREIAIMTAISGG